MASGTASPDRPARTPGAGPTRIHLRVPALGAYGPLSTLTASGLAERAGFSAAAIERVEEAIDHAVTALIGPARPAAGARPEDVVLDVSFELEPGRLMVQLAEQRGGTTGGGLPGDVWRRLDRRLAPLVSSLERTVDGARLRFEGSAAPNTPTP